MVAGESPFVENSDFANSLKRKLQNENSNEYNAYRLDPNNNSFTNKEPK